MAEVVSILEGLPEIEVHFACNDPDSGNFVGVVGMVELCSADGETLMGVSGEDVAIEFHNGGIVTVDGLHYACGQRDQWVGNWCWDAVRMSLSDAQSLLKALLERRWQLEEWTPDGPFVDVINEHARRARKEPSSA